MTVNPLTHAASAMREAADDSQSSGSSASSSTTSTAADENQFLTLLVAQLKNQDPLNPTDSAQFMGELAQFSTLQEVIGVHQDLDSLVSASGVKTSAA